MSSIKLERHGKFTQEVVETTDPGGADHAVEAMDVVSEALEFLSEDIF